MISVGQPLLGEQEREAVDRVMRSGQIAQGPEVEHFETEFSNALVEGRPCVAVNSGTAGLHLGLLACGVGPGDEVVVPSFTFAATANAVALTGATPVFAHIDLRLVRAGCRQCQGGADPDRTVGVMPVHLYGHPADVDGLIALYASSTESPSSRMPRKRMEPHGMGSPSAALAAMAMFSLIPTKNMTSGEGGMVAVSDPPGRAPRSMRLLRNQGMLRPYENELVGFNARMTDLHAAIGRVQARQAPALERDTARECRIPSPESARRHRSHPSRTARRTFSTNTQSSLTAMRLNAIGWLERSGRGIRRRHRGVLPDSAP